MNKDAAKPAALFQVYLPGCFAVDDGEIVSQRGNGSNGHPMRNQHHWNSAFSCRQVEGDAVRVTVAGHYGKTKGGALKNVEVTAVKGDEFDYAQNFEELTASMQFTNQAGDPSPIRMTIS